MARQARRRPPTWLTAAAERYGDVAWVVTREQVLDEHWFGPAIAPPVAARLGDVALVAHDRSASTTPPTPARSRSSAGTAR